MRLDADQVARYRWAMNAPPKQSKFQAYRARKKAAGFREIRLWVPDLRSAEFKRELDAQVARINTAEDEREALIFCEEIAAEMWASLD